MIKKLLLPILGLGMAILSTAQSFSPSVISSSGAVSEGKHIRLEWTLGELSIRSLQTMDGLLTEGFHQPTIIVEMLDLPGTDLIMVSEENLNIIVAPNPVQSTLSIKIESNLDQGGIVYLSDFSGQQLKHLETKFSSQTLEWDLSLYPSGIYLLSFYSWDGDLYKQFKVSKLD